MTLTRVDVWRWSAALLTLAALFLVGCLPSNFAEVVREVAKSERSWCVAATGYGVNIKAGGSGVGDGDVSCGDGGLTLRSQSTQMGVPLTVVPQLSVGQPTLVLPPTLPPAPPRPPQSAPVPRAP